MVWPTERPKGSKDTEFQSSQTNGMAQLSKRSDQRMTQRFQAMVKFRREKKGQPKRELKHFSCTGCPHRNCSFADTRKCVHILQSNSITLLARLGELTMPCILLRQVVFYIFYTSFEMAHTRTGVQATNKL